MMASKQLLGHTKELREFNSTLILGKPFSASLLQSITYETRDKDNSVISSLRYEDKSEVSQCYGCW